MSYLEVAVAAPLDHTLIYSCPEYLQPDLIPGLRLLVPLGNRLVTGYFLGFISRPSEKIKNHQLKPINDILEENPLFPEKLIPFFRWVARYYHYPIGEVIKTALPSGLTVQSGRRIMLTDKGKIFLSRKNNSNNTYCYPWFSDLLKKGSLTPAATRRIWRTPDRAVLKSWDKKGWVEIKFELIGRKTHGRNEICVGFADHVFSRNIDLELTDKLKVTEQKTLALLSSLVQEKDPSKPQLIPRMDLIKIYPGARQALVTLEQKKMVILEERPVYRDPFGESFLDVAQPERLTEEQRSVLNRLLPNIGKEKFRTFLLHGVTGSGKTEIYLQAAAVALKYSKDVLILVPEIALASQLEAHFLARFGDRVALLHSGLTSSQLYDQWMRIVNGQAKVVIGARSAVFAPLPNAGLIVVDEEHEGSYKQEEGLRYQARDIAILRASLENATVLLGSATPSVNSFYNATIGKYQIVTLKHRIRRQALPEVQIVDLRNIKTVSGRPPLFSPVLISALRDNLECKHQSLIFLNRRGYANLVLCQNCGQSVQCQNCHITLTLHKKQKELRCHYCGYSASSALLCSKCRSSKLIHVGFGTERLEEELMKLLPAARLVRLDRDTCVKRRDYLTVLKAMHAHEKDILIGTQMIAKGHHFPNVTLVGIVWADAGLGMPDFRAGERTFQLISQVSGRAGRGLKKGRVIIQTHQPDHYSITFAKAHDYNGLYDKEISLRQELAYPPFSRLVTLRIEGKSENAVQDVSQDVARMAKKLNRSTRQAITVLGPSPAPLARLRGKYRWQVLLKSTNLDILHLICDNLLKQEAKLSRTKKVKILIDVDPENMM